MYTNYFKLSEPPFSLTPDPRYLFMSERHREGLAHLLYGVQQPGGFVQLTGEIGSGKTTLCRCLIRQLPPDTEVALILNPRLTVVELLATVCDELRIPYPAHTESIKIFIDALNQRLLEMHAQHRRPVLIIDEAQNLHSDVLEQIRLLTNLETAQEKLLQIILIGQPELLTLLGSSKLKQLSQRITARYHLDPLSRTETGAYIQHRLRVAGRLDPLFTRGALRCIYRLSGGVPRIINILCDRALLGAYAQDKRQITAGIIRQASRETSGQIPRYRRRRVAWAAGIAAAILLALGGAFMLNPKAVASGSVLQSVAGWLRPFRGNSAMRSHGEGAPSISAAAPESPAHPMGAAPAKGSAPGSRRQSSLVAMLSESGANDAASFASLYALWEAKVPSDAANLDCQSGAAEGFECLSQSGNWPKLRRYNLPAILDLVLPNGSRRRVALVGLNQDTATLVIRNRRHLFPILEIDQVWEGSFILLWKPPFAERPLSMGARGDGVRWVRNVLDRLDGQTSGSDNPEVYDEGLRQKVLAFQKRMSLVPDGFVGTETLARLVLAMQPKPPALTHHSR